MSRSSGREMVFGSTALIAATMAGLAVGGGCATRVDTVQDQATVPSKADQRTSLDWDGFWAAHSVSPPPPKSFLEYDAEPAEILNITQGLLGDDVVRKWILADVRRGQGDSWAAQHMRVDIVNAGVLGPPGLNGTDRSIATERAKGTTAVTCKSGTIAAAGVVAVPKEQQQQKPWAGLTDFVIVQVFRSTGEPCTRTLADGRTETLPRRRQPGELSWQLDTGEFRDHPVIGPLWYQARGWSCNMDGTGDLDEICALVRPSAGTAAMAAQPGVAPPTASSSPSTGDKMVSPTIGKQQLISGDMPRLPPLVLTPGRRYIELVKICVTDTGSVSKITTLTSSNDLLNEVVRDTVKDWKYKPIEIDGHSVAFCYAARFVFAP